MQFIFVFLFGGRLIFLILHPFLLGGPGVYLRPTGVGRSDSTTILSHLKSTLSSDEFKTLRSERTITNIIELKRCEDTSIFNYANYYKTKLCTKLNETN